MKKIFFYCLFLCFTQSLHAQSDTLSCDYLDRDTTQFQQLPYFGNNAYLETFLDSIGYPAAGTANRIVGPDRAKFHVPIKFWVYRNSLGVGGPNERQLRDYMDNLNKEFSIDNNTTIGFYMRCEIGYINDDSHVNVETNLEALRLLQSHKERGCINVHIANTLTDDALGVQYRARFFGIDGIFLSSATYLRTDLFGSSFPHEVGHYFNLDHTHQYYNKGTCRKEAISRTRTWPTLNFCFSRLKSNRICEATGDGLDDTPADPELNSNNSCTYNSNGSYTGRTDLWGDYYATPPAGAAVPDTRNMMSYNGDRTCRTIFSRHQIAVMLLSLYRGNNSNNKNDWQDLRGEYDDYEMDNFSASARSIIYNETQEHNFNQQYYGDGNWGQCDVDWVRYTPTCTNTMNIFTGPIAGRTNANTRLTLFNNSITQLAQNDDISSSNLYSNINWNFTANQEYFIRIENISVNTTGYYTLNVGGPLTINGPSLLCASQTYNILNQPPNANITWSISPNIATLSCTTCPQPTLTKAGDGNVTLTASISTLCSTAPVTITKQISVGNSVPSGTSSISSNCRSNYFNILNTSLSSSCSKNTAIYFTYNMIDSRYSNLVWTAVSIPAGASWYVNGNSLNMTVTTPSSQGSTSAKVHLQASGPCGVYNVDFTSSAAYVGGFKYAVTPNPAQDNITVMSYDESQDKLSSANLIYGIKISDQTGILKKYFTYKSGITVTGISLAGLRSGVYIISVFDGQKWSGKQLIISR